MDNFFGKKIVRVYITGRYFEDCDVNGVQDDPDNPTVCGYRSDINAVVWDIDISTGKIENWNGQVVTTYYKLVDEGEYVLEVNGKCIEDVEGVYVPDFLQIDEDGYGDYVHLTINENGKIFGWGDKQKKQVVEFFEEYGENNDDYSSLVTNEYSFDAKKVKDELVKWIGNWFAENGPDCNAVVGISGGKDSTVVAALCVEALGKDRVIGVMMPNGEQKDINDSIEVCNLLGIKNYTVNIGPAVEAIKGEIGFELSAQSNTNLPARIRMSTLYAVSQSNNGRVANTCNLSENYVGYETKFGDAAGDFSPLAKLAVREVLQIGDCLGLPRHLVHKTPIDGLNTNEDGTYVTDEQSLGFTYDELDDYLLEAKLPSEEKLKKIEWMHRRAVAKERMLTFKKE